MPLTGGTPRPFLGEGDPDARLVSRRRPSRLFQRRRPAIRCSGRPHRRRRTAQIRPTEDWSAPQNEACTTTIRSGHRTANGSTSCTGSRAEPTDEWTSGVFAPSGGTPERLTQQHAAVNFLAPIDARTLLYVGARRGRVGTMAVGARRRAARSRAGSPRASSSTRRCRPVATAGAWSPPVANPTASLWTVPILDRIAEDRDAQPYPVPDGRALAPRFGGTSLFYLSAAERATGCGRFRDGRPSKSGRARTGVCSSPRRLAGRAPRGGQSKATRASTCWRSCWRTALTSERWRRPSTSGPPTGRPTANGS